MSDRKRSRPDATTRARKAFARRQRARRWLTWRYVAAAVLAVVLLIFGIYALYFSSWLRAEKVEVSGNSLVTADEILAAAEVPIGDALVRVDLDAVAARVRSLAAIKDVDVSRKWPHGVRIDVTERVPIAVLERGAGRVALAADGTSFPAPPSARKGLPLVRIGVGADKDALSEGAAVVDALDPAVSELVEYLEVRTVDNILLHLRDGRLVRWGSAESSTDKAAVLLDLLNRKARVYNVTVPSQPTTR